jgi:2,4-dienoyl-CoA reductase (NADPH2)
VGLRAFEPAHLPGLTALAEAIHGEGAKAVVQINYLSRYSGQPGALAPSAVPAFGNPELMPREMTAEDMAVMADAFAESADIVRQAGFDGVELHGATGYLLSSFTSPRTNLRTDEYGGSVENRMRFPLQVFDTVRRKVGDFPIGYRFMAREYLDWGLSLEDGVACARLLAVKKPAYLSVSAGTHECFAMYGKKKKFPVGFMLPEAAAVKKPCRTRR